MLKSLISGLLIALLLPMGAAQRATFYNQNFTTGAAPPPTIRGSNINSSSSAGSLTTSLPAGATAGDFTLLFACSGFSPSLPGGWSSVTTSGSTWACLVASKALSSGDISTGSITVSFGGTFDCVLALVEFIGATGGVREFQQDVSTFTTSSTLTTTGAVLSTDYTVYWLSSRTFQATTPSIVPASGSANPLQSAATTDGSTIMADQRMPGGALAVTYAYTAGVTNGSAIQVVVIP